MELNCQRWVSEISFTLIQAELRESSEFRLSDFEAFIDGVRESVSRHLHHLVLESADLQVRIISKKNNCSEVINFYFFSSSLSLQPLEIFFFYLEENFFKRSLKKQIHIFRLFQLIPHNMVV